MRSSANIKSHPVHPMLIAFPIGLLSITVLFDILSIFLDMKELYTAAYYTQIAGIISGVIAAVPGAMDYFYTVPPNSSGKKRATRHAVLNVINLIIFFIAWKLKDTNVYIYIPLTLEIIGMIIMTIAGWMGGTLAYRNQIGVDHRYAYSGKWKEEIKQKSDGEIYAAETEELKLNQMKLLVIGDKRIVLGRTENGYTAFDDHCTHRGGSLADGVMICRTVQCPWHGSQFDVSTGKVIAGPSDKDINIYRISQREGKVYLIL